MQIPSHVLQPAICTTLFKYDPKDHALVKAVEFFDGQSVDSVACLNSYFANKIRSINCVFSSILEKIHQSHWTILRGLPPPIPIYFQLEQINKLFKQQNKQLTLSNRVVFSSAIKNGYTELVELIIRRDLYKYDSDFQGQQMCRPLRDIAFLRAADYGNMSMVTHFLKTADINAQEDLRTCEQRKFEQIDSIDINEVDMCFKACYHPKKFYEDDPVNHDVNWKRINMNVQYAMDPMYERGLDYAQTALIHAARHNHEDMVHHLITAKADIEACTGENNRTALMEAVTHGSIKALQLLLAAKANPNVATAKYYVTPLMEAAYNDSGECVSLLLQAKADVHVKNVFQESVLLYINDYQKMEQLLTLYKNGAPSVGKGNRVDEENEIDNDLMPDKTCFYTDEENELPHSELILTDEEDNNAEDDDKENERVPLRETILIVSDDEENERVPLRETILIVSDDEESECVPLPETTHIDDQESDNEENELVSLRGTAHIDSDDEESECVPLPEPLRETIHIDSDSDDEENERVPLRDKTERSHDRPLIEQGSLKKQKTKT